MREIIFRGKRADKDVFVEGDLIHGVGGKFGRMFILPMVHIYPSGCNDMDGWEVIPETIGQFTGLIDKNGVKIWEGDIIKSWLTDHSREWTHIVEWKGLAWNFKCNWASDKILAFSSTMLHSKNCHEVIGNIHTNAIIEA